MQQSDPKSEAFLDGRVTAWSGDFRDVLDLSEPDAFDSCVTDPPYHLTSIVKRMSATGAKPVGFGSDGRFQRMSRGFMGKEWDGGETAFEPETWKAVYRVLKPGSHLLAFGAPKNFGFMQYAIAQAGFEVRDVLAWLFGSGFPKSHNQPGGWGTALKPAFEPIILARKPLVGTVAQNMTQFGTGGLNIDGCRVPTDEQGARAGGRRPSTHEGYQRPGATMFQDKTDWSLASNGRWPANVVHDGSPEVVEGFPDSISSATPRNRAPRADRSQWRNGGADYNDTTEYGDTGSAARFFYTAKADADDRLGSKHPTVKPVDLMQWLVRLVTPKGGLVLDPFAGTGTTGEAAFREGMRAVLIEREPEYQRDIARRMALCLAGPEERARATIKEKTKDQPADHGPLFSEIWDHPLSETNPDYRPGNDVV